MEARELMIGNYVEYYHLSDDKLTMNTYVKIDYVSDTGVGYCGKGYAIDFVKPIPLTEEWLVKLGAKGYSSFGQYKQLIIEGDNELLICRILPNGGISLFCLDRCDREGLRFINQCRYVHKFQNIAFELGEELTIKEELTDLRLRDGIVNHDPNITNADHHKI